MLISASALPILAVLAIFLRRNFFKGKWKVIFLTIGAALLFLAIFDSFKEHKNNLTLLDAIVSISTALATFYILSRFSHGHTHSKDIAGAKGIVISEAFHSLFDGMVIGMTYLVNPLLGYSATIGIIIHETPKMLGTLAIFRSMGLSIKKTIIYGMWAQIGSPAAAVLIYLFGKNFNPEQFQAFEIASVSSLAAIVLWIIYLEIKFHIKHKNVNNKNSHSSHHNHDH